MTDEEREELIREVAARHGVVLGRDDPILILRTLHERVVQDAIRQYDEALESFKSEMEAATSRWSTEAKAKAERILTVALAASKEAMAQGFQEGAETVRREIAATVADLNARAAQVRYAAALNVVATVLTCCAAGLTLWAALK